MKTNTLRNTFALILINIVFCVFNAQENNTTLPVQDTEIINHCQHKINNYQTVYQSIKPLLNMYQRPFTLIELGASQGFFSFQIAEEYESTCVMIENDFNYKSISKGTFTELCTIYDSFGNLILLWDHLNSTKLNRLASCEHFDVVLVFDLLNYIDNDWQQSIKSLLDLGEITIIEIPDPAISKNPQTIYQIESLLIKNNAQIICKHGNNKIMLVKKQKKELTRTYWLHRIKSTNYQIKSDFLRKQIYYRNNRKTLNWQPGINLLTFKMLNGCYPLINTIEQNLTKLSNTYNDKAHRDFMMWNIIIQGENLVAIDDNNDKHGFVVAQEKTLSLMLGMLEQETPDDSIRYLINQWPIIVREYNQNPNGLINSLIHTNKL